MWGACWTLSLHTLLFNPCSVWGSFFPHPADVAAAELESESRSNAKAHAFLCCTNHKPCWERNRIKLKLLWYWLKLFKKKMQLAALTFPPSGFLWPSDRGITVQRKGRTVSKLSVATILECSAVSNGSKGTWLWFPKCWSAHVLPHFLRSRIAESGALESLQGRLCTSVLAN